MKRKEICCKCKKKFTLGKAIADRWFWDNHTVYYDCGSKCFTPANEWTVNRYTCGDCNTDTDKGIPYPYIDKKE